MSPIDELDIVIRHKGKKVSAGIPQLALWATAGDAHAAITALEQKRAGFLADLAEAGGLEDLEPRPYMVSSASPSRRGELRQFTLKALIVVGLIAGLFTLSGALLAAKIERVVRDTNAKMQQYTKIGGPQFWEKMEHELDRAADPASDVPPEQKKKLLAQIHVIVERWRPFMAEIAPLFADFQKPAPAAVSPTQGQPAPTAAPAQSELAPAVSQTQSER
jgi:hypothetical protein